MGAWFRDYVFYPCSLSRPVKALAGFAKKHAGRDAAKRVSVFAATFVCWFATGIWHGPAWHFVFWGLLNGAVILVSQEMEPLYGRFHRAFPKMTSSRAYRAFQVVRTFLLQSCLWMLYSYADAGLAFRQFVRMFTEFSLTRLFSAKEYLSLGLTGTDYLIVLVGVLLMFAVSMRQRKGSVREQICAQPYALRYSMFLILFFVTLLLGRYGVGYDAQQFIYNQF
jgi:D-alanyl-lipoteichoic acid acyltransferase DltB (MBOAT superfamily)